MGDLICKFASGCKDETEEGLRLVHEGFEHAISINLCKRSEMDLPCSIGRANAAVLPLPVSAKPIKSRPCSASGIDSVCIGVGALYPKAVQASDSESMIPRSLKLLDTAAAGSELPKRGFTVRSISSPLSLGFFVSSPDKALSVAFGSGAVSFSLRFFRAGIVIISRCVLRLFVDFGQDRGGHRSGNDERRYKPNSLSILYTLVLSQLGMLKRRLLISDDVLKHLV